LTAALADLAEAANRDRSIESSEQLRSFFPQTRRSAVKKGDQPVEKMHFTRMDQGSDEDFQILKRVHEQTLADLPERLMEMVSDLSGDAAYNLNRRDHSLQAATRALHDSASEELIVVALLHDIGESLGP
jgi:hypothetical protein